ncbi:GAF domain-containing protein [Aureibacter tunicatorum]
MGIWDRLFSDKIGSNQSYSDVQNRRLIRIVSIICIFIVVPYIIIANMYNEEAIYFPLASEAFFIIVFFVNAYIKKNAILRLLVCVVSMINTSILHLMVISPDEDPIYSLYLLQFAILSGPWVMFKLKEEKWWLIVSNAVNFLIFMAFLNAEGLNYMQDEGNRLSDDKMITMFFDVSAVFTSFMCLFLLKWNHGITQDKNARLMEKMELSNKALEDKSTQLSGYIEKVEQKQAEEEDRQWIADGVTRVGNTLVIGEDFDEIKDNMISCIVNYMNINQAGLYVLAEDEAGDEFLNLTTSYAFTRGRIEQKRVEIGDGLLGQAYKDKEVICIEELDDSFFSISSGLGDAHACSVLIIPLIHNEKVQAVLELGSLSVFTPRMKEMVKAFGSSIASFIENNKLTKYNMRLLSESQEQTDMMKQQEEVMRQNLEELMSTQEDFDKQMRRYKEINKEKDERIQELESKLESMSL